jgi:hypothetical protein
MKFPDIRKKFPGMTLWDTSCDPREWYITSMTCDDNCVKGGSVPK